jgi:hypothetical protein
MVMLEVVFFISLCELLCKIMSLKYFYIHNYMFITSFIIIKYFFIY